jgi:hypothetical protein
MYQFQQAPTLKTILENENSTSGFEEGAKYNQEAMMFAKQEQSVTTNIDMESPSPLNLSKGQIQRSSTLR